MSLNKEKLGRETVDFFKKFGFFKQIRSILFNFGGVNPMNGVGGKFYLYNRRNDFINDLRDCRSFFFQGPGLQA